MVYMPSLRRARGYYGRRRSAYRAGGFKRFARRGPRRAPARGRVLAPRMMVNPSLSSSHNVVAPRFFTNLEFGYAGLLNGSTGYQFSILGNGIYLPGDTSNTFPGTLFPATHALTALQPVGLTALGGLYGQYRVWESTITVSVVPLTGVVSGPYYNSACQLVILPTRSEEALSDVQQAQSLPYSKYKICNANGAQKDNTSICKIDTRTVYGITDAQQTADENYAANFNANPSNSWWWSIVLANFQNALFAADIVIRVNYRVELFNPGMNEADT